MAKKLATRSTPVAADSLRKRTRNRASTSSVFTSAAGQALLRGAAVVLLAAVVYWPTFDNGFIWDDETYVENNLSLRSLAGLRDIWFQIGATPQYYPLVHSTFWAEYHLWGLNPRGYHVVNLLLHAASAVLLWRLLLVLQVPGAWLAAAIFAVHPVHVETVAWVTERKNVLSGLLALAAILAYLQFSPPVQEDISQRSSARSRGAWWFYALALVFFIMALLAKTVTCSVPAVLVLIYWWKRGGFPWREAVRLIPFFAIGLSMASLTVWMEEHRVLAVGDEWNLSPLERVLVAGRAVCFYAAKLVWPHPLIFFYPRWAINPSQWGQYVFPLLAAGVMVALFVSRHRLGRGPLAAVLIFAGVLVPALGFFNVYPFRFSYVADHFQYHASMALIALVAAGVTSATRRWFPAWGVPAVAIALLLPLLVLARHRTAVYHDLESLYLDTIAQNPTSWAAHHNLGCYLEARGELTRAVEHYRAAVGCDSSQSRTRISLGAALLLQQQLPEAEQQLTHALTLARDRYDRSYALTLLGNVHTAQKRYADAFANYLAAISEKPDNWSARIAYAAALRESGDFEAALAVLREVAELSPRDAEICSQVGKQLVAAGRMRDSVALFERAVQFAPDQPKFRQEFAEVLFQVREFERAEVQLRELIKLEPRSAHAHNLLGATLANRNEIPAAIEQFRAALRIDPTNREAQQNLARAVRAQN